MQEHAIEKSIKQECVENLLGNHFQSTISDEDEKNNWNDILSGSVQSISNLNAPSDQIMELPTNKVIQVKKKQQVSCKSLSSVVHLFCFARKQ